MKSEYHFPVDRKPFHTPHCRKRGSRHELYYLERAAILPLHIINLSQLDSTVEIQLLKTRSTSPEVAHIKCTYILTKSTYSSPRWYIQTPTYHSMLPRNLLFHLSNAFLTIRRYSKLVKMSTSTSSPNRNRNRNRTPPTSHPTAQPRSPRPSPQTTTSTSPA